MQNVFLSYSSQDHEAVDLLAHDLSQQGVSYWRDQERLYAGQRSPKELGVAIGARDCVLLVWSKHSAASYYVEMEWCTGIALKKAILPFRLDDTPLPEILRSIQTADLRSPNALQSVLTFLRTTPTSSDACRTSTVLEELNAITATDPKEVVETARTRFVQRGWVIQNIFQGPVTVYQGPVYVTPPQPPDSNLVTLRKRVKSDWIEGILANSLHGVVQLELGKQSYNRAIDDPWKEVIELENESVQPLPSNKRIIEIFNKAGGFLLILGDPGSGKTSTLLELTSDLIASAEIDPSKPVPVVLNLSTWKESDISLNNWIVGELRSKYYVGNRLSEDWLKKSRLLLMLDGLDEVKSNARASCVAAINAFLEEYTPAGIVVSCRFTEYEVLPIRLRFKAAIKVLPLTTDQIDQYVAAPGLEAVRTAVQADAQLRELAQSPLVLNIMVLAYKDEKSGDALIETGVTRDQRHKNLMDRYIAKMFKRKGSEAKQPYKHETVIHNLSWLALHLVEQSQTVFLIESLQPDWLTGRAAWMFYWIGTRIILALAYALIIGFVYELGWIGPKLPLGPELLLASSLGVITLATATGLIDGQLYRRKRKRNNKSKTRFVFRWGFVLRWLLYSGVFLLTTLMYSLFTFREMNLVVSACVIYMAPVLSYLSIRRDAIGDIQTGAFGWSWTRAERGFFSGVNVLLTGLVFAPIVLPLMLDVKYNSPIMAGVLGTCTALIVFLVGSYLWRRFRRANEGYSVVSRMGYVSYAVRLILSLSVSCLVMLGAYYLSSNDLLNLVIVGVLIGFPFLTIFYVAAVPALFSGILPSAVESTAVPNQGIIMTLRHALLSSFLVLVIGLAMISSPSAFLSREPLAFLSRDMVISKMFLSYLLIAVGIVGLWYGGSVVRHFWLRTILWYQGHIPRQFSHFLDYTASLIFLQKVGGGYVFIHRLVMEHFASLKGGTPKFLSSPALEITTNQ